MAAVLLEANDQMSMTTLDNHPRLQLLTGAIWLDTKLCDRLLNGQRRQVAAEFGLSSQEINVVMAIQANTFQDFVRGLLDWTAQPSVA